MQNSDVKEWYNDFTVSQLKTSVNLRHYSIVTKLIKSGLKKNSKVIEIGCGIGTLTGLILNYISKGHLVGVDISDESIKIANERLGNAKNMELLVSDMKNFNHNIKFDFVVLPDVLEHIPENDHPNLFKTLDNITHEKSKVIIHIPHPKALDFYRENQPQLLQIIDQSIEADSLLKSAYQANFVLNKYMAYKLFNDQPDYVYIEFEKKYLQSPLSISKTKIILKKLKLRLTYLLNLYFN
jgi:trans-aconitate 2-methyltransferase